MAATGPSASRGSSRDRPPEAAALPEPRCALRLSERARSGPGGRRTGARPVAGGGRELPLSPGPAGWAGGRLSHRRLLRVAALGRGGARDPRDGPLRRSVARAAGCRRSSHRTRGGEVLRRRELDQPRLLRRARPSAGRTTNTSRSSSGGAAAFSPGMRWRTSGSATRSATSAASAKPCPTCATTRASRRTVRGAGSGSAGASRVSGASSEARASYRKAIALSEAGADETEAPTLLAELDDF